MLIEYLDIDICQFRLRKYREIDGKITIDPALHVMMLLPGAKPQRLKMTCANCECPFHELQTEGELSSISALGCMVTDAVKQVKFRAGDMLFVKGQPSSSLYSVRSGLVKITCHSADSKEQIVGLSSPGRLLVGLQSISDECYEYSAIAATDVSVCKIQHRALLNSVNDRTEVALRLIDALNAQLAYSRSLMRVMGHKSAASKLASFILLLAPKPKKGNGHFTLPLSRMDMADLLGLSEETVCRQMANMKRKGILYAPRGRMEIQDWKQLRAIANQAANQGPP